MTTGKDGPQTIDTRIGALEFAHDFANGYPTDATVQKLYDERDFQRACQAYLWALPAVSFTAWQRGINGLGARNGQVVAILSYEARRGILTANATTPYYLGFADLSSGPLIILVGHPLRRRYARTDPERPEDRRSLVADGSPQERRRLGRHLLRPGRARGLREELDPDGARQELVRVLPLLPAHRAVLRSLVAVAGLRAAIERTTESRPRAISGRRC
jgi:hypothetical protein